MRNSILLLAILNAFFCSSQNLIVDANELGTQLYNLNILRKVTFSDDSMQIHLQSGQTDSWAKVDVRFMVFEDAPLNQHIIDQIVSDFKFYPIPNEGIINIEWISKLTGSINFELMDLNGKNLYKQSVNVSQIGKQAVKLELPQWISSGVYFLKVNQDITTIYQKVIIQK
jgi:hypothetical protein